MFIVIIIGDSGFLRYQVKVPRYLLTNVPYPEVRYLPKVLLVVSGSYMYHKPIR